MLTFRQKIVVSQGVLLVLFLVLLTPLVSWTVHRLSQRSLERNLQAAVSQARDLDQLNAALLAQSSSLFAVFDASGNRVKESPSFPQVDLKQQIDRTLSMGSSYSEAYVPAAMQELAFIATRLRLDSVNYVLVQAVSVAEQRQLTLGLELDLVLWIALVLILFMLITWLILYWVSRPIHRILETIRPFQEGRVDQLPEISLARQPGRDDLSRLGETLNALSRRIRSQLEMSKEFVANASHEFKTPITIIRGFAETLHDHPNLPPETAREITAKIVRNCERMDRMIRNLLALANMERLPISRLQEANLGDVVEQCRTLILEIYPDAQVAIEQEPGDYTLMCDPDLLSQAIFNLLDNAAKYSERPARITMRLYHTAQTLLLDVADRGIGIPREELDKIFQRFYTVSKQRSQILGGSGLGLSIVQTIIQKHMGSIRVDSEVGVGTTFTVELPTRLEEADHAEA